MIVYKKFVLIEYSETSVYHKLLPELSLGTVEGPYYSKVSPTRIFDTEEEAIAEAYKRSKYGNYIIVPHISFDRYED